MLELVVFVWKETIAVLIVDRIAASAIAFNDVATLYDLPWDDPVKSAVLIVEWFPGDRA